MERYDLILLHLKLYKCSVCELSRRTMDNCDNFNCILIIIFSQIRVKRLEFCTFVKQCISRFK